MSAADKGAWLVVAGWRVNTTTNGDYAEQVGSANYIEVQHDGTFEVAYELDQSARSMNLPAHLLTRVPAEVIRALLNSYDAKPPDNASTILRLAQSAAWHEGYEAATNDTSEEGALNPYFREGDRQLTEPTPAQLARLELVEQLTRALEQLNTGVSRANPDDTLAFAEIAAALRETADGADRLAADEGDGQP